jgi:hypothetical protein
MASFRQSRLKVVLGESCITGLPAFLWRFSRTGGDQDTDSWVDAAGRIVRTIVRMTLQPIDAPADGEAFQTSSTSCAGGDVPHSSDYPHWQFDATARPHCFRRPWHKFMVENDSSLPPAEDAMSWEMAMTWNCATP